MLLLGHFLNGSTIFYEASLFIFHCMKLLPRKAKRIFVFRISQDMQLQILKINCSEKVHFLFFM